jgi:hypothetical protein
MLRIFVDYNGYEYDDTGTKVYIDPDLQPDILAHLAPGLRVTLFDCETLEFEATIGFEPTQQVWYGLLDVSTRRDLPPAPECA